MKKMRSKLIVVLIVAILAASLSSNLAFADNETSLPEEPQIVLEYRIKRKQIYNKTSADSRGF